MKWIFRFGSGASTASQQQPINNQSNNMSAIQIVLPTIGSPYILDTMTPITKVVQGEVFEFKHDEDNKTRIHPTFWKEDKNWDIIRKFFDRMTAGKCSKQTGVWCNENGIHDCVPNPAIYRERWNGMNPVYGDVMITIATKRDAKAVEGLPTYPLGGEAMCDDH